MTSIEIFWLMYGMMGFGTFIATYQIADDSGLPWIFRVILCAGFGAAFPIYLTYLLIAIMYKNAQE